jgi:hypothetical protein
VKDKLLASSCYLHSKASHPFSNTRGLPPLSRCTLPGLEHIYCKDSTWRQHLVYDQTKRRFQSDWPNGSTIYPLGRGVGGTEKVNVFPVGCWGQDLLNFDVPNLIPKMFCDSYSAMHLFSSETDFFIFLRKHILQKNRRRTLLPFIWSPLSLLNNPFPFLEIVKPRAWEFEMDFPLEKIQSFEQSETRLVGGSWLHVKPCIMQSCTQHNF